MQSTDHPVCKVADLPKGTMKSVEVGATKILLGWVNGKLFAVGATCPHYGAPLAEGALCGDRLVCPWHQSKFELSTGKLLEPPTLDHLPVYAAWVEGEQIVVRVPSAWRDRVAPNGRARTEPKELTALIVGAGAAGLMAAQTLRDVGFAGRVILVGPEEKLPYDRPQLTKNYLAGASLDSPLVLRGADFYSARNIEIRRATVTGVDFARKTVHFDDGPDQAYTALLLATGGKPKPLKVKGAGLENVRLLRSLADANELISSARPGERAVVVGSGYIGMEAAASLTRRGLSVALVSPEEIPLEKSLGAPIGKMLQKVHEKKGVQFHLGKKVKEFKGNRDGAVSGVVLDDGARLTADLVLVGAGIAPATKFLKDTSASLNKDGQIEVDSRLRALDQSGKPIPGVWAAGDITRFPLPLTGEPTHIEHWRLAQQHGRIVALNIAGTDTEYAGVPFFWSFQFGVRLSYVGFTKEWDEIIVDGKPADQDFIAYYIKDDRVLAAAGCGRGAAMAALSELMRQGRTFTADEVRKKSPDFIELAGAATGE